MPAYATAAQLRAYLDKLTPAQTADGVFEPILDRARNVIDLVLGFSFFDADASWPAAAAKAVRAERSRWLRLPPYQLGSITQIVVTGQTAAITDWEEEPDAGRGVLYRDERWEATRYTITAVWGYGPAPAAVVEVNLELAVNIWQGKAAGRFSDVIGAEGGGAVGYAKALTGQQKLVLEKVREQYRDPFQ